jgi:hypothetical protein
VFFFVCYSFNAIYIIYVIPIRIYIYSRRTNIIPFGVYSPGRAGTNNVIRTRFQRLYNIVVELTRHKIDRISRRPCQLRLTCNVRLLYRYISVRGQPNSRPVETSSQSNFGHYVFILVNTILYTRTPPRLR